MKKATSKRTPVRDRKGASKLGIPQRPNVADVDKYNGIVASAELLGVNLVCSSSIVHLERFTDEELVLRVDRPQFRAECFADSMLLNCGVRLTATLEAPSGEEAPSSEGKEVVRVFAEYSVSYRLREGIECGEDVAYLFASRNAVFNAWPFFRELALSLVTRMGMPPLILPLLRMPPEPKTVTP